MTPRRFGAALAALGCVLAGPVLAAKLPIYDDFSSETIDRSKWRQSAEVRFVDSKQALIGRRFYGGTSSDSGLLAESYGLSMTDGTPPKGLAADITVLETEVEGCPANPSPSFARARLSAAYFNRLRTPVPGDRTGDVIAQVRVGQTSASSDVVVQGVVSSCLDANCDNSTVIGQVNFANATLGVKLNGRIDWVKADKTFRFTIDGLSTQDVVYTDAHGNAPVLPFVQIAVRSEAANCTTQRVRTSLLSRFDNVRVAR